MEWNRDRVFIFCWNESLPWGPTFVPSPFSLWPVPSSISLPLSHSLPPSSLLIPPSHQVMWGRLLQRNVISSVNVASALSLFFSHNLTHKCFSSFCLSLISQEEEKRKRAAKQAQKMGCALRFLCALLVYPNVLDCLTWRPPCSMFLPIFSPLQREE